ncbi:hypothetical protein ABPG74_017415 [Tetrahymena malaccensis]
MEQLIQAIGVFVNPQSKSDQVNQADKYLKNVERTKECWLLSIQILEIPHGNFQQEVYLLAAKMLKSKMEYDFAQLSAQEQQELPSKLMRIIQLHKEGSRGIQSSLVDAFIFCYLHMYDKWPDFIEFMKSNFYTDPSMQNYIFLIYEYLPDNVYSTTIVIDDEHRNKMITYFKENLQKRVVEELNLIAQSQNINEKSQYSLLKIMANWVDFKTNSSILSVLQNHAVFNLALRSMNNDSLQKYSAKTIVAALRQLKGEKEQLEYKDLFLHIASFVFNYFTDCETAYQNEDYESVQNYSLVFSKFGSRAISQFMKPESIDAACEQFLLNMLKVTKYESVEHEEDLADFWIEFILKIIVNKDANQKKILTDRYTALIQDLLNICILKSMYDQEIFQLFQEKTSKEIDNMKEEFESKNKLRFHMKELVNEISNLIGAEQFIRYCAFQMQSNGILEEIGPNYPLLKARQLESILSCLNEVVFKAKRNEPILPNEGEDGNLGDSEDEDDYREIFSETSKTHIFDILQNVLKGQYIWIRLNRTILNLIISSSDFLQQNLEVCGIAFELIVLHLETPLVTDLSQSGFEVLCRDCPLFVQKNIETFIQKVYSKMMFNYNIIAGISHAICATDECISSHLISLCSPYANDILNYTKLPVEQQNDKEVINSLKKPIKAIKNIIQCVPEREQQGAFPHSILQEIFKQIWDVLKFIMENKKNYTSLIENIVSVIKQFIIKMNVDFDIFFIEFLQQIIILFKHSYQSGILYIIEKCVKIFQNSKYHEQFTPYLQQAFETLVDTTLSNLKSIDDFTENPDLVEDFYGFVGRFLKYFPGIFLSSQFLHSILSSIQIGIKLQHREAAKALFALMELLYEIINTKHVQKIQNLAHLIQPYQNALINQYTLQYNNLLFEELSQVPSKEIRQYIYDIFIAQIDCFGSASVNFFYPIFQNIKEDICTNKEKEKFFKILSNLQLPINEQAEDEIADFFVLLGERFKKSYRRNN